MNFSDKWLHNNGEIISIKFSRILQIHLQFEVVGNELKKFRYYLNSENIVTELTFFWVVWLLAKHGHLK